MATRRAKPVVPKAGVTKNRGRRYCGGGKMAKGHSFKCGGKMKK